MFFFQNAIRTFVSCVLVVIVVVILTVDIATITEACLCKNSNNRSWYVLV